MTINVKDIINQAWAKAQTLPAEERFTAVSLLDAIGPHLGDTFWRQVEELLLNKSNEHGSYRRMVAGHEQPLIKDKQIESGYASVGKVRSFVWADLEAE